MLLVIVTKSNSKYLNMWMKCFNIEHDSFFDEFKVKANELELYLFFPYLTLILVHLIIRTSGVVKESNAFPTKIDFDFSSLNVWRFSFSQSCIKCLINKKRTSSVLVKFNSIKFKKIVENHTKIFLILYFHCTVRSICRTSLTLDSKVNKPNWL